MSGHMMRINSCIQTTTRTFWNAGSHFIAFWNSFSVFPIYKDCTGSRHFHHQPKSSMKTYRVSHFPDPLLLLSKFLKQPLCFKFKSGNYRMERERESRVHQITNTGFWYPFILVSHCLRLASVQPLSSCILSVIHPYQCALVNGK